MSCHLKHSPGQQLSFGLLYLQARGEFLENQIYSNTYAGVWITSQSNPTIKWENIQALVVNYVIKEMVHADVPGDLSHNFAEIFTRCRDRYQVIPTLHLCWWCRFVATKSRAYICAVYFCLAGFSGVSSYIRDLHSSENFWCKVHSFVFSLSNQSSTVLDVSCICVLCVECQAISKYRLCIAVKFSPRFLLAF